jgi:hypothetical protein
MMIKTYFIVKSLFRNYSSLVDIFEKKSNLNKSLQGAQINALTQNDKVNSFMRS